MLLHFGEFEIEQIREVVWHDRQLLLCRHLLHLKVLRVEQVEGNASILACEGPLGWSHLAHLRQRVPGYSQLAPSSLNLGSCGHWHLRQERGRHFCVRIAQVIDGCRGAHAFTRCDTEGRLMHFGLQRGNLWWLDHTATIDTVLT